MSDATSNVSSFSPALPPHRFGADVLAVGLGTAVAMWAAGYVTHMPALRLPAAVVFFALLIVLMFGGYLGGRLTRRTWRGGLVMALVTALTNLLIFGSIFGDPALRDEATMLALSVPGYFLVTIGLMLFPFEIGRRMRQIDRPQPAWPMWLAACVTAATLMVVTAGGLVTGFEAGFAVHDWPTTRQTNMFLYPLSQMTGGIYYEHTHRLFGTLVGLTAIVLLVWTLRADPRRYLKGLVAAALVLVIVQGVIGGLWVTDVEADETARAAALASDQHFEAVPNVGYILFHGTTGQLLLGLMAVITAMFAPAWGDRGRGWSSDSAGTDRSLAVALLVVLLLQLLLGVYLRKTGGALLMHISFAAVVALLAIGVGVRAWGVHGERSPVLRRLGLTLLIVLGVQLTLGVLALFMRDPTLPATVRVNTPDTASPIDALVTTLHQTTGAILLATASVTTAWVYRLIKPAPMSARQAESPGAAAGHVPPPAAAR